MKKILHIIGSLDPQKAHGWDDLSINVVKLCNIEIFRPLYLIYMKCLETRRFPSSWKKASVLPIRKKENRQLKKNYRHISLLPICGKIFEKLMFDVIYEFLCENQLLTPNQSGCRPGDSTIRKLLSVTQKINSAFDEFPSRKTRAVFLGHIQDMHLTKCGLMVSTLSLKAMVFLAVYLPLLKTF